MEEQPIFFMEKYGMWVGTRREDVSEAYYRSGNFDQHPWHGFASTGSAFRDEAVFDRPNEYDPRRERLSWHMAFGALNRICIGAPLARLEMRKTMGVLTDRFPTMRLADDQATLTYTQSLVIPSLRSHFSEAA